MDTHTTTRIRELLTWPLIVLLAALGIVTDGGERWGYLILALFLLLYRRDYLFLTAVASVVQRNVEMLKKAFSENVQRTESQFLSLEGRVTTLEKQRAANEILLTREIREVGSFPGWWPKLIGGGAVALCVAIAVLYVELLQVRNELEVRAEHAQKVEKDLAALRTSQEELVAQASTNEEKSQRTGSFVQAQLGSLSERVATIEQSRAASATLTASVKSRQGLTPDQVRARFSQTEGSPIRSLR